MRLRSRGVIAVPHTATEIGGPRARTPSLSGSVDADLVERAAHRTIDGEREDRSLAEQVYETVVPTVAARRQADGLHYKIRRRPGQDARAGRCPLARPPYVDAY